MITHPQQLRKRNLHVAIIQTLLGQQTSTQHRRIFIVRRNTNGNGTMILQTEFNGGIIISIC